MEFAGKTNEWLGNSQFIEKCNLKLVSETAYYESYRKRNISIVCNSNSLPGPISIS